LQVLNTGLVPGNRNADNVDQVMEQFDYILYPSRSIQTDGIKAFSVTSFGFGQKGAQAIGVHPRYLYATLDEQTYKEYCAKVQARQKKAYRFFHNGLINNSLFVAKDKAPYTDEQLSSVLLNPDARVKEEEAGKLTFPKNFMQLSEQLRIQSAGVDSKTASLDALLARTESLEAAVARDARRAENAHTRVGVDIEEVSAVNSENETFVERNFTEAEIEYCRSKASGRSEQASFAGRWSAKEAVFKALGVPSQGGGAAMKDIEIVKEANGPPTVKVCSSRE
jgi:fatty acid synthase subunit alpha